jgi:sigma-E factor negative regulatory protein RseC
VIEQQGRVVDVMPVQACIEVGPAEGCNRCASGKGCGAGIFVRLINRKPIRLTIDRIQPLQPGQVVTIGIPESLFLRWVLVLYGLPLLAAFVIAVPAQYLSERLGLSAGVTDLFVLAGSVTGFAAALMILKKRSVPAVSESSLSLIDEHSSQNTRLCDG